MAELCLSFALGAPLCFIQYSIILCTYSICCTKVHYGCVKNLSIFQYFPAQFGFILIYKVSLFCYSGLLSYLIQSLDFNACRH